MGETTGAGQSPARRLRFPAALLAIAIAAAFGNSLTAPFVFDDIPSIVENPSIRRLAEFWSPEYQPGLAGTSVMGRPVVNLSFALNYALGGLDPRGYHLANLLIHCGATLLLFGLLRRTLRCPVVPEWLQGVAGPVAFAAAAVWALHPLQTESVTCVVHRSESLAGFFYLAALYGFVRATEAGGTVLRRWFVVSLAAGLAGVLTKETLATLPLMVLLYDRTFGAGSFREAWRRHGWFHVLLALTWVPLGVLIWQAQGRGGTVTLGGEVNAWMSLLTQSRAVATYLQLAFWPHPLVLDYGDYVSDTVDHLGQVLPEFLLVTALGLAVLWALVRRPVAGFLGAWFFVILAPSSSFVPLLSQMRAEHRMYLPLVAVMVPLVILLWRWTGRAAPWLVGAWALALGGVTAARNHDYRTVLALWNDTVEKQPDNPRAHYYFGLELEQAGDRAAAWREYREAVRLYPGYADGHLALAILLLLESRAEEAQPHIAAAAQFSPETSQANNKLGQARLLNGEVDKAIEHFTAALRLNPGNYEAHNNLGYALAVQSRYPEAIAHFRFSVERLPSARGFGNLGDALLQTGQVEAGIASLTEALRLDPGFTAARSSLATALAGRRRYEEALPHYEKIVSAEPGNIPALFNLGIVQRRLGRVEAARETFRRVLALEPGNERATRQLEQLGPEPAR